MSTAPERPAVATVGMSALGRADPHPIVNARGLPWQPDRGDGNYQNPVLFADYSDPDVIRVGDDYWMVSSSFSHVPGLPLLHSRDLINWTLINHALPRLVPDEHFSVPHPGEGVWAPALRYHDKTFWIYYPDPDFGIYVVTSPDPRQPWSKPKLVLAGKGLIDPCPLWDDDGQVYLIHGWAKSRSGICNRLSLHTLASDGKSVVGNGRVLIDADQLPNWHTLEGPKLYKRHGYYYIFAPAGGVTDGYQAVFRARSLFGPYENRIVLAQGSTSVNGPHQGAWVETARGEHWFFHFQDRGAYGRIVHLQPLHWGKDDWPLIGRHSTSAAPGEPVLSHRKPNADLAAPTGPIVSDEFDRESFGLQWQWQANPTREWHSLTARPGWLRLHAVVLTHKNLWSAGNLFLQKFPAPSFSFTTRMDFSGAKAGVDAGLVIFGYDYAWLGIRFGTTGPRIVQAFCRDAQTHQPEQELFSNTLPALESIYLRTKIDPDAVCHFSYSLDGQSYTRAGTPFQARASRWVGAKTGLFAASRGAATTTAAHVDFDWAHVSS